MDYNKSLKKQFQKGAISAAFLSGMLMLAAAPAWADTGAEAVPENETANSQVTEEPAQIELLPQEENRLAGYGVLAFIALSMIGWSRIEKKYGETPYRRGSKYVSHDDRYGYDYGHHHDHNHPRP